MSRYAEQTSVSSERSRAEIESTLTRYGADQFGYGWSGEQAMVSFRAHGRLVRFVLTLPDRNDTEFTHTPARRNRRTPAQQEQAWEQACRQRWRALALVVKAKLEAVAAGITEFDAEFLAHIVLPAGGTVGEWIAPQLDAAYDAGRMPSALPELGPGS